MKERSIKHDFEDSRLITSRAKESKRRQWSGGKTVRLDEAEFEQPSISWRHLEDIKTKLRIVCQGVGGWIKKQMLGLGI